MFSAKKTNLTLTLTLNSKSNFSLTAKRQNSSGRHMFWHFTYFLAPKGHKELVPTFGGQVCTSEDHSVGPHCMKKLHHLEDIYSLIFSNIVLLG